MSRPKGSKNKPKRFKEVLREIENKYVQKHGHDTLRIELEIKSKEYRGLFGWLRKLLGM
jgi:sporulation-control protein spo0M